ncbi:HAD family hydrolase [Caproicibacter sp.]|uniref:HAD family hydrolase n=1 Tax=Caproicibacter sp. TaxID=2814884 RepID=UPI00398976C8
MEKHTAAVFDLDGTLLDSLTVWSRVDREFLRRRGLEVPPDYTETVSAMSFTEAARYTVGRFALPEAPEELIREWNGMVAREYAQRIALKPGARECLRVLEERGVRLGVATALPEELYGPALKHNGIYGCFGAFASVTETARGKGFPDVYLLCAERLGVTPGSCAVFEDVLPGLIGAKAAGMNAVGVYDENSNLCEKDALSVGDGYVRSLEELTEEKFYRKFF